ncbi:PREDICTED: calmodulin-lysine N-methyltransferase-like [Priapulus caudatus]|uniref:Calmodulin-lysine N-methyltransferase n=1 Tax=Priapulus caudatus TaxID=37621 RepID=A0ABM1F4T7_PRICU|nr:PREDICTED: calmodulin-lysine N-methyltransferase-like [Priapulus caudatus]
MSNSLASRRWKILRQAITKRTGSSDETSSISVRRFQSFGLIHTGSLPKEVVCTTQTGSFWQTNYSKEFPDFTVYIRYLTALNLDDLVGFNNTGNVCVWPSEEVLTYYCLKNRDLFSRKSICELGGGMTCLAAVALSVIPGGADRVLMTDGNANSINNLKEILKHNKDRLKSSSIEVRSLQWDRYEEYLDIEHQFDVILSADCLFFDKAHEDLLHTIQKLLTNKGTAFLLAPSRSGTLDSFVKRAQSSFNVEKQEQYDDHVWQRHCEVRQSDPCYNENLHYPLLLKLSKRD